MNNVMNDPMAQMMSRHRNGIPFPTAVLAIAMQMDIHEAGTDPHALGIQHLRIRGNFKVCSHCPDPFAIQKQGRIFQHPTGQNCFCIDNSFHKNSLQIFCVHW